MQKKSKKIGKNMDFVSSKLPSYLTSNNRPQNLRRYFAKEDRLANMDKKAFHALGEPKPMPKKDMSWPQAKIRFPLLKPMKDADKDGVKNIFDCKPFDKSRQGKNHDEEIAIGFGHIKEMKTIGDVQKLEEEFLKKEEEE